MLEGHHKMAQRFAEESSSDSKSAEEADRRIVEGTATDDDLLRLAGPRIPPYMAELFLSNRLLLAGILPEQEIVPQQQLERVIGTNAVQALQRNGTVWKNAMIETLSKLIEEEFTLDEIRFQIRYYEEHPRLRDMMAKIPQLMSRALKNPDPITSEKFRRLQGKRK